MHGDDGDDVETMETMERAGEVWGEISRSPLPIDRVTVLVLHRAVLLP